MTDAQPQTDAPTAAPQLLLTGPVGHLEEWAEHLEGCGWQVAAEPLITIRPRRLSAPKGPFDWVALTSSNAWAALEPHAAGLQGLRFAVVGERSASHVRAAGLEVAVGPYPSADELLEAWRPLIRLGERVLWPRGPLSDRLAKRLRAFGAQVEAPLAYENVPAADTGPLPAADAIFLASPSAVDRLLSRGFEGRPLAIAIGATTHTALARHAERFARVEELPEPRPEALREALIGLTV